jgi:uncharacterized protein
MASIRFVLSLLSAIALWFVPQLANAENNKLFMWKATHGKSTVYLVGSIHLVPRDFYPLPKDMEKALEDSQTLVLEIKNPDDPSGQKKAVELGMYFDGDNIENHLSDETKTALSKYTANCDKMTAMALYKMRPWCASTTIELLELQKRGFDKDFGLDKHFLKEAQDQKKPVGERRVPTQPAVRLLGGHAGQDVEVHAARCGNNRSRHEGNARRVEVR